MTKLSKARQATTTAVEALTPDERRAVPKGVGQSAKKGHAGNRGLGRSSGSLNKTTLRMRDYILKVGNPVDFLLAVMHGEPFTQPESKRDIETGLIETVYPTEDQRIDAAKQLLPRVMPTLKPVDTAQGIPLKNIRNADDVLTAINSVIDMLKQGEIGPADAAPLLGVIEKAREAIATDQLAEEIARLREMIENADEDGGGDE